MFIYLEENNRSEILAFLTVELKQLLWPDPWGLLAFICSCTRACGDSPVDLRLHLKSGEFSLILVKNVPDKEPNPFHRRALKWALDGCKTSPSSSSSSLFMTAPCTRLAGKNPRLCQLLKQQRRFCCSKALLLLGNLPCSFFSRGKVNVQGARSQFSVVNMQPLSVLGSMALSLSWALLYREQTQFPWQCKHKYVPHSKEWLTRAAENRETSLS